MPEAKHDVLAVDAALLLPLEARERVMSINSLLFAEQPSGFLFSPTCVPHITLAQLFVRRDNLLELIRRADAVLRHAEPLELSVTKLAARNQVSSLRITRTPELLRLHATLLDELKAVSEPDGRVESFYRLHDSADAEAGEAAREMDIAYVAGFRKHSSYGRYMPHITLGYGSPPVPDVFMDLRCTEAALFQLGRFCTCRQLLHRWKLA